MARYERLGLFNPLGTPKKQSLTELAAELAGEAPPTASSGMDSGLEKDDDDDFSTEDALAASQAALDALMKRAEEEKRRQSS